MKIFIEKEYSIGGKWLACDTEETFALLSNTINAVGLECSGDSSSFILSEHSDHSQWEQVFSILALMNVEILEVNTRGTSFAQGIRNLGYEMFYGEDDYW